MIFQLAHSAGGYYITTTLLRFKTNFIKRLKNLADNNSEYLYKLGQKELDSTLSLSEQHIHDAWVAYNVAKLKAQYDMNNSPSHDEIAQSLYDFFEAAENVMKCMGL